MRGWVELMSVAAISEVIRTERLVLRPFRPDDVGDVFEYAADTEWSRYTVALPAAPYLRADAEKFLADQALLDRTSHASWAIEFQGRAVGGVNIRFSCAHQIGELGYGLARRLWGQGLASEAARAVVKAAFDTYPQLIRMRAKADARNARSLRVLEKLGMRQEGLLRRDRLFRGELVDEAIYGLLREEWRS
jgi:[ribosomal protein S5]-alanine N-acetyltransferase